MPDERESGKKEIEREGKREEASDGECVRGYSEKNEIARDRKRSGRKREASDGIDEIGKEEEGKKKIEESRRNPKVEREREREMVIAKERERNGGGGAREGERWIRRVGRRENEKEGEKACT